MPEPPDGYRLVLATTNLLESLGTRSADGQLLSFEWGGPDEHGWYVPTITVTDDGWLDGIRAEAREQGAAEERERLRTMWRVWWMLNSRVSTAAQAHEAIDGLLADPEEGA